jgi:hypothetical protein
VEHQCESRDVARCDSDGTSQVTSVIALLQTGEPVESVVANCFPTLARVQVYEGLAYYEDHRGEIDLLVSRLLQTEA